MAGHRGMQRKPGPQASTIDAALEALDASELRAVIRGMVRTLDDSARSRLASEVIDRAARSPSGWLPPGPDDSIVEEIEEYAGSACDVGYADPSVVDDYLREGSNAFLGRKYRQAARIFRALLGPIGTGDIDLGQDELVEEVLGTDLDAVATQFAVSAYMTATPARRAQAVLLAMDELHFGQFLSPLRALEEAAVEPLPGFGDFLSQWRSALDERTQADRNPEWDTDPGFDWDSDAERWQREVVERMQGTGGLAELARASRRTGDLHAWCDALVAAGNWKGALAAFDDAAEIAVDRPYARGDFLDGAALAAERLGRSDLPVRLARACREAPSMARLRRWLGSSKSRKTLRERVSEALAVCPRDQIRQIALLTLLGGNFEAAAKLLAAAPGLGWSSDDHPGHVLFPLFVSLLGDEPLEVDESDVVDDFDVAGALGDGRLATPAVAELVELAGLRAPDDAKVRAAVLVAMRQSAEKRIAGVTGKQRRRHYAHAASLALACRRIDGSAGTAKWFADIQAEYRRYPALQRELGVERVARRNAT